MVKCRIKIATSGPHGPILPGGNDRHGRASARQTETDPGNPAFLGRHTSRRIAAATLRRLRHVYFPPRPFCPACGCRKVSIFKARGGAKLYSYVIHHRPVPGFTPPYAIAVVELDEGPRMMSNIVDCPQTPEALELDMKLEVKFEPLDDNITLPLFRPAKG
jgi:uncharacterized protein